MCRGKGRGESERRSAGGETTLSAGQQRRETIGREAVAYRCAQQVHRHTESAVTEACINNVAERNRMQILPYIRVYRGLAEAEQTLSFSASPSG